jgi:hypothetical protein
VAQAHFQSHLRKKHSEVTTWWPASDYPLSLNGPFFTFWVRHSLQRILLLRLFWILARSVAWENLWICDCHSHLSRITANRGDLSLGVTLVASRKFRKHLGNTRWQSP